MNVPKRGGAVLAPLDFNELLGNPRSWQSDLFRSAVTSGRVSLPAPPGQTRMLIGGHASHCATIRLNTPRWSCSPGRGSSYLATSSRRLERRSPISGARSDWIRFGTLQRAYYARLAVDAAELRGASRVDRYMDVLRIASGVVRLWCAGYRGVLLISGVRFAVFGWRVGAGSRRGRRAQAARRDSRTTGPAARG